MNSPVLVTVAPVTSFAELAAEWRALEAEAAPVPPFRSWSWVGCLAEERYPDPVLLRAEAAGRLVGLALFNRRQGRLALAESGEGRLDAPYIEHNAPLLRSDQAGALAKLLDAAARLPGVRRLVLSGVGPEVAVAAPGVAWRRRASPAPFVDLRVVRDAGDPLAHLSANTRQQVRRSLRRFAEAGPVELVAARDGVEAGAWLDALIGLHQQSWQARGKPGAFADPFMRRFHAALIARAMAQDELDLLRLTAGGTVLGYLYNLRRDGHVCAYQSGFAAEAADAQRKPGLVAHLLAIGQAAARGDAVYDFLAGEARYKSSLATGSRDLVWTEQVSAWSWRGLVARLARVLRRGQA
mgnify:CR=1 FL=1